MTVKNKLKWTVESGEMFTETDDVTYEIFNAGVGKKVLYINNKKAGTFKSYKEAQTFSDADHRGRCL